MFQHLHRWKNNIHWKKNKLKTTFMIHVTYGGIPGILGRPYQT